MMATMSELLAWRDENAVSVPWIVCGDFNATPDSDVVQLLQRAGFRASHAGQPKAATCNANQRAKLIDYIFHNDGMKQESIPLIPVDDTTPLPGPGQASDHVPVIAEFDFV